VKVDGIRNRNTISPLKILFQQEELSAVSSAQVEIVNSFPSTTTGFKLNHSECLLYLKMENRILDIDNAALAMQLNGVILNDDMGIVRNEPANIEEDNQLPRNPDGSLDGGIVVPTDSKKTNANECDLVSNTI
jgi:hypothetical protein